MKKLSTHWKLFAATFLILGLVNCFETKKEDNNDQISAILAVVNASNLQIAGNWSAYNGTPSFAGDAFSSAGTVKTGEYTITNYTFKQVSGTSTYEANILAYDNSKQAIYVQFTAHPFGAAGKFSAYYWNYFTDNKFYLCADLTGNKTTLDAVKASTQSNDKTNMNTGCYTNNTFTPGTGSIWNRFEAR
ncbi:LIC13354 family exoprotein [Leptospira barantonii]|uniref:Lipoprotein n=1 Tax=Leptospira barantonii TaxID=2023184 RepID=A0ABX4NHE3_9LEPT|nr:hypothetical protein [Leptospira barantonii]PJZ56214.1 hypothetical protein CH367_15250 [Leptospira barantonii]